MTSSLYPPLKKIGTVLGQPRYLALAFISWFFILGILLWLFSFDTLLYVLSLPNFAAGAKLEYFLSPYVNSFVFFFQDPVTATRLLFSALTGIGVALYAYLRSHAPKGISQRNKGIGGFTVALLGSGCIACGTSIISPLLIGAGAGATAIIGTIIGTFGYLVGIALMLIALTGLAKRIPTDRSDFTN